MTLGVTLAVAVTLVGVTPARGATQESERPDAVLERIARAVASGDRPTAHRVADSLLAASVPGSPVFGEALYWRAFSSSNAADAERDYLRLAIEYPLLPRAEDALLLLAQLEFARGDRVRALRHLDRLVRDHPSGRNVGKASFWTARIAFDSGDTERGCRALSVARAQLPAEDVETRNQLEYFVPRCMTNATGVAAGGDSTTVASGSAAAGASGFTVQVAAYKTKREADALRARLARRGFDVRVSYAEPWYRVRVGRYPTRADADAALGRMRKSKVSGRVVDAEPPAAGRGGR
jgi:hypothetical protein